jgi:hypothetical protein
MFNTIVGAGAVGAKAGAASLRLRPKDAAPRGSASATLMASQFVDKRTVAVCDIFSNYICRRSCSLITLWLRLHKKDAAPAPQHCS